MALLYSSNDDVLDIYKYWIYPFFPVTNLATHATKRNKIHRWKGQRMTTIGKRHRYIL